MEYSGAQLEYIGPQLDYSGAKLEYSGAKLEYSGAPLEYSGAPLEYSVAQLDYSVAQLRYGGAFDFECNSTKYGSDISTEMKMNLFDLFYIFSSLITIRSLRYTVTSLSVCSAEKRANQDDISMRLADLVESS